VRVGLWMRRIKKKDWDCGCAGGQEVALWIADIDRHGLFIDTWPDKFKGCS
jgi:hypothetical protein